MNFSDGLQITVFVIALISLSPILGIAMAKVFDEEWISKTSWLGKCERALYRIFAVNPDQSMTAKEYLTALLAFNLLGLVVVFLIQILQGVLPLNPQGLSGVRWDSALNTAVSFVTNTNWQGYAGETTMSYFTQMVALTAQNFLSAATGFAVFLALTRGIRARMGEATQKQDLGNFWVDVTRSTLYILVPLSLVAALALVSQGVVQNYSAYQETKTLEGVSQTIPMGPAASQIAIKQLGTNGGGFFNANSAHPFENPTPFSNFLQMLMIVLIPAALIFTYGRMAKHMRHAWTLFFVMFFVWFATLVGSLASEYATNPLFQMDGLMEGKEVRFGVTNSLIWSTITTAASNGSVNTMHSSLSPLAGGLAMFNIMLGEVIFGGIGSGLYGMLLFVLLTVFLSGLMVGRSPEYFGKKIEAFEMKWAMLGVLAPCATILILAAVSSVLPIALSSLSHQGPHGFSEILYAVTSAVGNNGSAFAGLNANTPYFNLILGAAMLIGRFVVIVPVLMIAGSLAQKKASPPSSGTFATDTPLFACLLIGVLLIVGALTFLPALSLGPIVEFLAL